MRAYKSRPVAVLASQWGLMDTRPPRFVPNSVLRRVRRPWPFGRRVWQLQTAAGWVAVQPTDWFVRSTSGQFSAVKSAKFKREYAPALRGVK